MSFKPLYPFLYNHGLRLVNVRIDTSCEEKKCYLLSEDRLAASDQSIVDQREDTSSQRSGSRSTRDGALSAVPDVGEVETLGGKIGVGTSLLVVKAVV